MRVATMRLLLAATVAACSGSRTRMNRAPMDEPSIESVLAMHNDSLMALPGVVGTAIGRYNGAPCIRVFVRDSATATRMTIGDRLHGYLGRVEVSGQFYAR
jgi:hypothetical protein